MWGFDSDTLAMSEVRAGLRSLDSLPDLGADGGRVRGSPRLSGPDLYFARVQRAFDGEPQMPLPGMPADTRLPEEDEEDDRDREPEGGGEPEEELKHGRDAWLERLPNLCDEFNREYGHNLKVHRTRARSVLKEY